MLFRKKSNSEIYYIDQGRFALGNKTRKLLGFKPLLLLGPGIIAGLAGDDAGGIATYSSVGADYGYKFLWLFALLIPTLSVIQMMSVRLGVISGKGLTSLIRERFSLGSAMFGITSLFISNSLTAVSEFFGIAASLELFNIPRFIGVPVAGFIVWWLIVKGSYKKVEALFLILSSLFISYIAAAILAKPDWGHVIRDTFIPTFRFNKEYLVLFVATIATSITPYMQIFAQSAVVEKGIGIRDLKFAQLDAVLGSVLAIVIAVFIVITTGATLNPNGIVVNTAEDAARALAPLAGNYATILFGLGLFGASMMAAGVLPLTTAFSTCEAFGWRAGVNYSYKQAPIFYTIFTLLIIIGVMLAIIPGIPLIRLLILAYVLNGIFLPIELFYMLKLSNDRSLMDKYVNGPIFNLFCSIILVVITVSVALMLISYVI